MNRTTKLAAVAAILIVATLLGVRHGDQTEAIAPAPTAPARAAQAAPATPAIVTAPVASVGRDPAEWQGMLVGTENRAACDTSSRCGLAAACIEGTCGGCTSDDQCASGEVCTLDHCVKQELASCRSRRDCGAEELCVLSGYSTDARGNADLTARCLPHSGNAPAAPAVDSQAIAAATRPQVDPSALQNEALAAAQAD